MMEARATKTSAPAFGERSPHRLSPDGSVELILREVKGDEADSENGPGHGKHYLLRDLKSGKESGVREAARVLKARSSNSS